MTTYDVKPVWDELAARLDYQSAIKQVQDVQTNSGIVLWHFLEPRLHHIMYVHGLYEEWINLHLKAKYVGHNAFYLASLEKTMRDQAVPTWGVSLDDVLTPTVHFTDASDAMLFKLAHS